MSRITVPKRYSGVVPSHWSRFILENRAITFLLDNKSYCLKAVILNPLQTAALPTFCHNKPYLCQPKGRTLTVLPLRCVTARAGEWQTGSFLSTQTPAELYHTQSNTEVQKIHKVKRSVLKTGWGQKWGGGEGQKKRHSQKSAHRWLYLIHSTLQNAAVDGNFPL